MQFVACYVIMDDGFEIDITDEVTLLHLIGEGHVDRIVIGTVDQRTSRVLTEFQFVSIPIMPLAFGRHLKNG